MWLTKKQLKIKFSAEIAFECDNAIFLVVDMKDFILDVEDTEYEGR